MPHSVQETSLSSLCPTLSHQSSVAGGYVKLSEEAIDGVHVAFPYHFIDSIQVRHCAVDWRETVSDGLTRCARLVGALCGSIGQSLGGWQFRGHICQTDRGKISKIIGLHKQPILH